MRARSSLLPLSPRWKINVDEARISLRIPSDLKALLEQRARRNRRSVNAELLAILEFVIEVEGE